MYWCYFYFITNFGTNPSFDFHKIEPKVTDSSICVGNNEVTATINPVGEHTAEDWHTKTF